MTAMDSCGSLWTTSITPLERDLHAGRVDDARPGDDPEALGVIIAGIVASRLPRWRRARAFAPSKIEAVIPRQILQRGLGPSAEMLDHLGSGERSKPCSRAIVHAARQSDQKCILHRQLP